VTARLASAPVTWGVWERTVGRDDLLSPTELLGAVRSLGYRAIELGPPGYFGEDPDTVRSTLEAAALVLVGAFVPLHLADESAFSSDLEELERTARILAGAGSNALVLLADAGSPERSVAAGQPDELARTQLTGAALDSAVRRLTVAAERCKEHGLRAAIHPEAASYVEAPAEVEAMLERIDPVLLGACLDTGHILVGGGDPVRLAQEWADRLCHVHLKDVDAGLLERLRTGRLDIEAAWAKGLFCPFGRGVVDLEGVLSAPALRGFDGWIVLEQDRIAVRHTDLDSVRAVEAANLALVQRLVGG
jgi:inosose dehydratase